MSEKEKLEGRGATGVAVEEARRNVASAAAESVVGKETTLLGVVISPEETQSS